MKRGKFWLAGLLIVPVGVGVTAYEGLKMSPMLACESVSEQSTYSVRLQCAQLKADRQTPEYLAEAIQLITYESPEEPRTAESQRLAKQWSKDLIGKGEAAFHAGDLEKAISIIQQLPMRSPERAEIETHIKTWKTAWAKGEELEKAAKSQLDKGQWYQAFQLAHRLRQIDNSYWSTERHAALVEQIQSDRELNDWKLKNPVRPDVIAKQKAEQLKLANLKKPVPRTAIAARPEKAVKPVVMQKVDPQPIDLHQTPALVDPTPQATVEPKIEVDLPVQTLPVLEPANPEMSTPTPTPTPEG